MSKKKREIVGILKMCAVEYFLLMLEMKMLLGPLLASFYGGGGGGVVSKNDDQYK